MIESEVIQRNVSKGIDSIPKEMEYVLWMNIRCDSIKNTIVEKENNEDSRK